MFSDARETKIEYTPGSIFNKPQKFLPMTLQKRTADSFLLSAFMVVRTNCEEACAQKVLAHLEEDKVKEYRDNSKFGQVAMKSKDDPLQHSLDGCVRRCFVQRLTKHLGEEARDYVLSTAFEYRQGDFQHFQLHNSQREVPKREVSFSGIERRLLEKFV